MSSRHVIEQRVSREPVSKPPWGRRSRRSLLPCSALLLVACGSSRGVSDLRDVSAEELLSRAYVLSERSNELFVMDLSTMSEIGKVDTNVGAGVNGNHMSMLSRDGSKIYGRAKNEDAAVVIDTKSLRVGPHRARGSSYPRRGLLRLPAGRARLALGGR